MTLAYLIKAMQRTPCEVAVKHILPAFRSLIARKLINEYNMSQVEVAELLGTTQAAISYYLSEKRGKKIRYFEEMEEVRRIAEEIAERIGKGLAKEDEVRSSFCLICRKLLEEESFRELLKI